MIDQHPGEFGGHKQCSSGNITFLGGNVILQDDVIKGLCDFMDRNPPR